MTTPDPAGLRNRVLDEVMDVVSGTPTFGDERMLVYRSELLNRLVGLRTIVSPAPDPVGLREAAEALCERWFDYLADDKDEHLRAGFLSLRAALATPAPRQWLVRATAMGTTIAEDEWGRPLYIITEQVPLPGVESIALATPAPLDEDVEKIVKWAALQPIGFGDWACVECHPTSDILVDGFRCVPHAARALAARLAATEQGT